MAFAAAKILIHCKWASSTTPSIYDGENALLKEVK